MGCMVGDAGEVLWEGLARRRRRGREVLVMVMAVAVAGCRRPAPAAYVRGKVKAVRASGGRARRWHCGHWGICHAALVLSSRRGD